MKTYQLRIFPTQQQIEQLLEFSSIKNDVWNTLIDIQQKQYKETGKIYTVFDLHKLCTTIKQEKIEWKKLNAKAIQVIASEAFRAYQSFFTKIKKDKSAKPPQKKIYKGFHTLTFNQSGWGFIENKIVINKIQFEYGSMYDNVCDFPIKELRIKHRNNKWLVDVVINDKPKYANKVEQETKILAIDLGLKRLGTGIDNEGNTFKIKNRARKINTYYYKQIAKIQNKRSKTTKGSKRNKHLKQALNKCYYKKNQQVKQALHTQSKQLSSMNYNTIVIGDLTIKKLMQQPKNKYSKISKSFGKTNIAMFINYLAYKCQANNVNLIKISEANTTQLNCLTGKLFKNKVELDDRIVDLGGNVLIDRDLNSAINILKRWEQKHLATVNRPLEINSDVLSSIIEKGSCIL